MGYVGKFVKLSKDVNPVVMIKNIVVYSINKYVLRKKFMVKKIHDYKLLLSLDDPGIARALAVVGSREGETKFLLEKMLRSDSIVLDVGANIGYYTSMIAKRINKKSGGFIYAVEPDPTNFHRLKANLKLNKITNVNTYLYAMSNKNCISKLHLSNLSNVHTLLPNDVQNQMSGNTINVRTISLPSFVKKIGNSSIDLIRMDIEGCEVEVLDSLVSFVKKNNSKPAVLFEIHSGKYNDKHSLVKQLKRLIKLGYKFKYMASSCPDLFEAYGYKHIAVIPTDGTTRYIYYNVKCNDGLKLITRCRAVVISG